jgi:hypothetical protein
VAREAASRGRLGSCDVTVDVGGKVVGVACSVGGDDLVRGEIGVPRLRRVIAATYAEVASVIGATPRTTSVSNGRLSDLKIL